MAQHPEQALEFPELIGIVFADEARGVTKLGVVLQP
jgi:hypothetical protein